MDTMDLLTVLIQLLSVIPLVRNTALETVWEEVPVRMANALADQAIRELIVL